MNIPIAPPPPFLAGLIGRGIGASRSPSIHLEEARALGFALDYRLVDLDALRWPDDRLEDAVTMLRTQGALGSNITFPFKQRIMPFCDDLDADAALLGAVNTLIFSAGKMKGANTDWIGFSWMIERDIGNVQGARVAQVGSGGAGSATAWALARMGVSELALFDPEASKADALVNRLSSHFPATRFTICSDAASAITGRDGVVNATPVGMTVLPGMPFDPAIMSPRQWLADIIYFPLETELLRAARANGQRCANGTSMVVGQAAAAFELLTGHVPDRERMLARLMTEIGGETSTPLAS